MKKIIRILSIIIALVVMCTCFTGCFITYDKEQDFKQVVAKVEPYIILNPETDLEPVLKEWIQENYPGADAQEKYESLTENEIQSAITEIIKQDASVGVWSKEFKFYKYQLANFINNYYQPGYDVNQLIDSIVKSVLTQQIGINTAYAYKQFNLIRWSQKEEDVVTEYKYKAVDSYLEEMKSVIMEERGETYVSGGISPEEDSNTQTTYPVYVDDTITGYQAWSKDELINECADLVLSADATAQQKAEYKNKIINLSSYALIKIINDYSKTVAYYLDKTTVDLQAEAGELNLNVDGMSDYEIMMAIDDYYYNERKSRDYQLSASRVPGVFGDDEKRSLENSAMDRVLTYVKAQTDAISNISKEDKQKIDDAWAYINNVKITKGLSYTYSALAESYIMEYLSGKSYREQLLVSLLEEYIESQVDVSSEEIMDRYASLLSYQKSAYSSSVDAYISAMENGELVLYNPTTEYFFVKHILVPFSAKQSQDLKDYEGSSKEQMYDNIEAYRAFLATQITGYEHKDGENYGNALTLDEIMADVRKTVAETSGADRDKAFTKLMYKYSTDTGGFTQKYGYKEKVSFADGEKSSYMPEFAQAAKQLYENGTLYELSDVVITDYGAHILMLTRTTQTVAEVGLYDYASASDNRTVYQIIKDELYNANLNDYFTKWNNEEIVENYDKSVKIYGNRFSNIIEEMGR